MWEAIFDPKPENRKVANRRDEAFASLCQAIRGDILLHRSDFIMNMRSLRRPDPKVALDFIEAEVRPSHIDAQISIDMKINTFKIKDDEKVPAMLNRFNMLISLLSPSKVPSDEIKIRHIKRALAARNELYLKYDLEIRTMLAMTSGLTFKIFTDGILKRCEEIKFEEECNIGTSNRPTPPVEEVNIANDRNQSGRPHYNDRDYRGRPQYGGRSHYGGRHSSSSYYSGRSFDRGRGRGRDTFNSDRGRGSGRSYGHRGGRSNHRGGRSNCSGGNSNYYGGHANKRNHDEAFNVEDEVVLFDRNETFIIDSGCTSHMTSNMQLLSELEAVEDRSVIVANGEELPVVAQGRCGPFQNVLFIPRLTRNLISVSQLDEEGFDIRFEEGKVLIENRNTGLVENIGVKKGRLYEFAGAVSERRADLTLWHKRLAHINEKDLSEMISGDVVKGINVRSNQNCFCKA
jgi:hypothetical protein